jgi:hypothetical protein
LKDSFEEAGKGFGETYKFRYYPARIDYIFADENESEKFENTIHKFRPFSYYGQIVSGSQICVYLILRRWFFK